MSASFPAADAASQNLRQTLRGDASRTVFLEAYVCVPIVVLGAPIGAWFIKNRSRLFISGILYVSIVTQFFWALYVLEVYRDLKLSSFSLGIFVLAVLFFNYMAKMGVRRLNWLSDIGKS